MTSILTKPSKRHSRAVRDLWYVTDFLNRKGFDGPDSPWRVFAGAKVRKRVQEFQHKVRAEVDAALRTPRLAGLRRLADEIEKMKLLRLLEISPVSRRIAPVLNFGDEKFAIEEVFSGDNTLEAAVYHYLDIALRTGAFTMLKKCRRRPCSKFFVSYRRDAHCCSLSCNAKFQNAEARKRGYFRKNYLDKKREKFNIARKLKGKPLDVIMKASHLTKLALIRAGIVEEEA